MMITNRARWLIGLGALALIAGLLLHQEPTAFAGLSLLVWIGSEWLHMVRRILTTGNDFVRVERILNGNARTVMPVTVEQELTVDLTVQVLSNNLNGLRCRIEDLVPAGFEVRGATSILADGPFRDPLHWQYQLRPQVIRKAVFPGLRIVISDLQGLFRQERFQPARQELTVLPFVVRPQATVSVLKSHNIQLMTGTHRHRSVGTSTELHGIRDYRTGDPPRSIAWKVSARLGRLMTCEYESEVPIRATILADLSPAQFRGRPGPAPADRIISACASIARLLLADRDPVACSLHFGSKRIWVPHGLGERHLLRVIWQLLAHGSNWETEEMDLGELSNIAWKCGLRLYPELFEPGLNLSRIPWLVGNWQRMRTRHAREELSVALAAIHRESAEWMLRLQTDDRLYRQYCGKLLAEADALVDQSQRELIDSRSSEQKTVEAICGALLTGVARARDNELYVLIGTIPRQRPVRERLEEAIRLTRARLHRVMFIDAAANMPSTRGADPRQLSSSLASREGLGHEDRTGFVQRLGSCGAKFSQLDDPRLMEILAAEIELIKSGRARIREHSR